MGDSIVFGILGLEALIVLACAIILIVLIFRRIKIKKEEDFEDRDN